jgi:hypothetical protein
LSTSNQNITNNSVPILSSFPIKFCAKLSEISAKLVKYFPPKRKPCQISRQKESLVKFPAKKKAVSKFPPKIMPYQISRQKKVLSIFPPKRKPSQIFPAKIV